MKSTKKLIAEGLLIVFSVLFALLIDKLFDDYKTVQKKSIAIESIHKELSQNAVILDEWRQHHLKIRDRVSEMAQGRNDSLKNELLKYDFFNLAVLTDNQSLIDAILTDTAWESAKSTGIISEFEFETTQSLTQVYSMQKELTQNTMAKILDYYFDSSAHDMEQLDQILIQFQLRFWELTGQEILLTELYKTAILQLEN